MSRRWLVLLLLTLLASPAWAQRSERARTLEELRAARDEIDSQRSRVVAARDAREARLAELNGQFGRQNEALRLLQAEDPLIPFFHRRKIDKARQELRLTTDQMSTVKDELESYERRERGLRLQLIEAIRAYVNRLLLKASQIADTRRAQADHYYSLAFRELAYADDLEGLPLDPGPLELRALEAELAFSRRRKASLVESYRERADGAAGQADSLDPRVAELQEDLQQLEEKAKYALPNLAELIRRTRTRLERMATYQTRLREHAEGYRARARQLERSLGEQDVERAGATEEDR